jgi:hypothetical protein
MQDVLERVITIYQCVSDFTLINFGHLVLLVPQLALAMLDDLLRFVNIQFRLLYGLKASSKDIEWCRGLLQRL